MPVRIPSTLRPVLVLALSALGCAAEERPSILTPQAAPVFAGPAAKAPTVARAPLSDRLRAAMTEQILAHATLFAAPGETPGNGRAKAAMADESGTDGSGDGAVMLPRYVVKSIGPSRHEVEPPELPLRRFAKVERTERRANGYSATLFRLLDGEAQVELNVVNSVGQGVDHARDFTRVEIAFRFRW